MKHSLQSPEATTENSKKLDATADFSFAADIFSSTVTAFAISAAWELGALDEINENGSINIKKFAELHQVNLQSLQAILNTLACKDIVTSNDDGTVSRGIFFQELFAAKGFFYWLTRGCGELFSSLPVLSHNKMRSGDFFQRDLRSVGVATRDLGHFFFNSPLDKALSSLQFETIADLGCGSAERLIRIVTTTTDTHKNSTLPDIHGVGIDISSRALELADEAIKAAHLEDKIALVRADARRLSPLRAFKDVDLLTCFLMGHDFWPRPSCVKALQKAKKAFPNAETFLLCDTYRSEAMPSRPAPLFTPGFEMAHAAMGVYLPTLDEWHEVFAEGGWKCSERIDIPNPPYTAMFILNPL